jgi:hypothetical protein
MAEPTFNFLRGEGVIATILYAVIYNVLSSYGVVLRARFAILNCVGRNTKGNGSTLTRRHYRVCHLPRLTREKSRKILARVDLMGGSVFSSLRIL